MVPSQTPTSTLLRYAHVFVLQSIPTALANGLPSGRLKGRRAGFRAISSVLYA
jgi:hypothetical protein